MTPCAWRRVCGCWRWRWAFFWRGPGALPSRPGREPGCRAPNRPDRSSRGGRRFPRPTRRELKACRFVGPASFAAKRRLLSAAACLLVTSQVPETSSLVAMEALACGTPVVALASDALREIVDHGVARRPLRMVRELLQRLLDAPDHRRRRAHLEVLDLHTAP